MRSAFLMAAAVALLASTAGPASAQYYHYDTAYNPYGGTAYGARTYNPYSGTARTATGAYNPYTGRTTTTKSYYNPYTGRYAAGARTYNPYTGRSAYRYRVGRR